MSEPAFRRRMMVLGREPQRAAALKSLAGGIVIAAAIVSFATSKAMWAFGALGAFVALLMARFYGSQPVAEETEVEVSRAGVRVKGELIASSKIAQGFWVPRAKAPSSVRLVSEVGATIFEAQVDGEDDAHAFLAALGRDAGTQRVTFEADPPFGAAARSRLTAAALAGCGLFWAAHSSSFLLAMGAIAMAVNFLVMTLAPVARVEVGTDGVFVKWLLHERFLSYADLATVQPTAKGVRFVPHRGKAYDVKFEKTAESDVDVLVHRDALVARVTEAMAVRDRASSRQELLGRLVRAGRDATAWAAELARVRTGEGEGYRSAAVRDEDLWEIVRDPSAPADARAGAAAVLRTSGERAKLRVAADAVAEPHLRVALEAAADDDDEALHAALAEVGRDSVRS